jgi:hypothetical protein
MCSENVFYSCEIQKEVPGTTIFVKAKDFGATFNATRSTMPLSTISIGDLCAGNKSARIRFVILTRERRELHSVTTTVDDIVGGSLIHQAGEGCSVQISDFEIYVKPTFVDYLRSGWGLSLANAIDYTASNGNPSTPSSLHFMGPNNQYEMALWSVG